MAAEQEPLDIGADGILRSREHIPLDSSDEDVEDQVKYDLSTEIWRTIVDTGEALHSAVSVQF